MRWSQTLIPTLKETPSEAVAESHKLMLRAGLIRQVGSGSYSYLPLGWRALKNVIDIVREEMDAAGAVELLMPSLWPVEILKESGRLDVFGKDLIRFTDRHDRENIMAPTHEEVITIIARDEIRSYRQLPITLYQIQTKFRDETRPRYGVLRTREFIMKDAYSFSAGQEGLDAAYDRMYDAYCRIFDRCGLEYTVVEAESGAMGGSSSHEFMVSSPLGMDSFAKCPECGYAANAERAEIPPLPEPERGGEKPCKELETPGQRTIEEVTEFLGTKAHRMVKTLIYMADGDAVAVLVRGDHEVNEAKLQRALGADELELADAMTIEKVTGAPMGFSGPVGLEGLKVVADQAVMCITKAVVGANKEDAHIVGVVPGRDFEPDEVADVRFITEDDCCAKCGSEIEMHQGIEVGHVFKLGTKYSKALGATFLDQDGEEKPYIMGCYGIGVNRILAALIETTADDGGIVWVPGTAPYDVEVLPLDVTNDEVAQKAEEVYDELSEAGISVLLDDRDERPGFKFKDADLVGVPVRIVIGRGFLKNGTLEVQTRKDKKQTDVAPEQIVGAVQAELDRLRPE